MGDFLFMFYIIVNTVVAIVFLIDKIKAIRHKWRIRESTLIALLIIAPYGGLLSMIIFRHKIRKGKFMIIGILMCVLIGVGYIWFQTNQLTVNKVAVTNARNINEKGIRVIQISDLHNKKFGKNNEQILNKITKSHPDIIVITGDLVDKKTADLDHVIQLINESIKICPHIYFVSGNHEHWSKQHPQLIERLKKSGVTILNNDNTHVIINGNDMNICGVDDPYMGFDNIHEAINGIDREHYTLLLAHAPDITDEVMPPYNIDLILCGHTHAGQVRLPYIGPIVSHNYGAFPNFKGEGVYVDKGVYFINDETKLYIDSGAGTSMMDIRFCNRAQISLIEIKGN